MVKIGKKYLPWNSLEAVTTTAEVGAVGNIGQNVWILVQDGIDEPDRALVGGGALLVDLYMVSKKIPSHPFSPLLLFLPGQ